MTVEMDKGAAELKRAESTTVPRHRKPTILVLPSVYGAGGARENGKARLTPAKSQCAGGNAKNVMPSQGGGIMGECGSCGTTVVWDSTFHAWGIFD